MGILDTLKSSSGFNMLDSFMNPDKAYKEAGKQSRKYWEEAKGYEKPFMEHGLDQYGRLNDAENALLHPDVLQNQWAQGYEQSPYAKNLLEANTGQGMDAASAMGLMGSSGAINNIQQGAGRITAEDRRNYLQDLMQKYMAGVGIGQNFYNTGANAANTLAGGAQTEGGRQAGLAYGQAAAPGQLFGKIIGTAASMYGGGGMGGAGGGSGFAGAGNQYNQFG